MSNAEKAGGWFPVRQYVSHVSHIKVHPTAHLHEASRSPSTGERASYTHQAAIQFPLVSLSPSPAAERERESERAGPARTEGTAISDPPVKFSSLDLNWNLTLTNCRESGDKGH